MKMYAMAEWSDAPVAVQGPTRRHLGEEGSLAPLARAVSGDALAEGDEEAGVDMDFDPLAETAEDDVAHESRAS